MPDPILDPQAIANLRQISPDDGDEFLRELIGIFLADTPKLIAAVEQALASGQLADLTRAAHSIKGSSSNFGALELCAIARVMEAQGKAGDLAGAKASLPGLLAANARLQSALEQLKLGT